MVRSVSSFKWSDSRGNISHINSSTTSNCFAQKEVFYDSLTECQTLQLGGKRVGIVGLGSIGSETAKRLVSFGCSIAYYSRKEKPHIPYAYYTNVHSLAANSDILILCCALTEGTRHIINKDVMLALGKEGIIINVGRGDLVDEKELAAHLVKGEIGGAGLDVFENEPKVPDELLALDNVVLSPHRAVLTPESFEAVQDLIIGNLRAFFSNEPLRSLVQYE